MALTLALVYNQLDNNLIGNQGVKEALYTATFDSSYATGGEAFDPTSDLATDFTTVYGVFCTPVSPASTITYLPVWDAANSKIMLFNSAGDGDAFDEAGADDASAFVCYVLIKGV